uniref:F-box domain-containing protein n=1 Tax=Panagrolaimus davidi TaxID=227884 RepID=A0A914R341_9BILA
MFIEEFPFLKLPYLCQQRFSQLLNLQTALNLSKCNHSSNFLIQKSVGKIGKLLISDLFKPSKTNSIIRIENGTDIYDFSCYGITISLFNRVFTNESFESLPKWNYSMDVKICVKWILEPAFIKLIETNICRFKFRGMCIFETGFEKFDKILYYLSKIKDVDVTFESCLSYIQYYEHRDRFIRSVEEKFPKFLFISNGMDLIIQTTTVSK